YIKEKLSFEPIEVLCLRRDSLDQCDRLNKLLASISWDIASGAYLHFKTEHHLERFLCPYNYSSMNQDTLHKYFSIVSEHFRILDLGDTYSRIKDISLRKQSWISKNTNISILVAPYPHSI
ncbi:hypothetical protein ACJX0J_030522, partial [Zea mays]